MVNKITECQLKELYIDTIKKCSSEEMKNVDEIIAYNVFEEFDIGFISFINLDNVYKLYENNLITEEMLNKTIELVEKIKFVQENSLWNMTAIKNNIEWANIVRICDNILKLDDTEYESMKNNN